MTDDAQIIDATLSGDSAAFGELVTKYQNRLYNTLVHVVGSAAEAQDVVQEAFIQAFVGLEGFQGRAAFFTWLYRIAINTAISQKRRRRPVQSVEQIREQTGDDPIDGGCGPEARVMAQERVQQVRAGLAALSAEHRVILVLREIDGRSYEEIADVLGLPVGTVRSRLHRARIQLREQLEEILHEELG